MIDDRLCLRELGISSAVGRRQKEADGDVGYEASDLQSAVVHDDPVEVDLAARPVCPQSHHMEPSRICDQRPPNPNSVPASTGRLSYFEPTLRQRVAIESQGSSTGRNSTPPTPGVITARPPSLLTGSLDALGERALGGIGSQRLPYLRRMGSRTGL